ncbi:MAG: hypothetical protein SGPRY_008592 [Prymnesium sp.]
MNSLDEGNIFYSDQRREDQRQDDSSPSVLCIHYKEFIRTFRVDEELVYRNLLREAISLRQYVLEVDIDHLMEYNDLLTNELLQRPGHHLPIFEKAALEAASSMAILDENSVVEVPELQITLTSTKQPISIRQLLSSQVSRVVMIPCASLLKAKATQISAKCKGCNFIKQIPYAAASSMHTCEIVPFRLNAPTRSPPILAEYEQVSLALRFHANLRASGWFRARADLRRGAALVVLQWSLLWRLQESPEMVPTGEMPRSVMLAADRHLVDRAVPGSRVTVTGIMSIMSQQSRHGNASIRTPYLQAEEEHFRELAREPDIFERICKSVAPAIYGSIEVKKAVACLLFGGARKELDDGARLRGDINLLLLGDPSVAKSQFLKFVEKAAPIALYTSGKGSSAAGLTATVIKDSNREFYLEGGAMVLADGGVDRVAIHEAMEQQTISIAKAGITTVLNSRTSVFAAANPVFGRYDDDKNAAEQVDFQTTILSRFDMIFILRDLYDAEKDMTLAKHIIDIHVQASNEAAIIACWAVIMSWCIACCPIV